MRFENFSFVDGLFMSGASILMVFILLTLLYFMIYLMNFLPKEGMSGGKGRGKPAAPAPPAASASDEEDEMVAMLTAAAVAKEELEGDIRIKSVKRIQ